MLNRRKFLTVGVTGAGGLAVALAIQSPLSRKPRTPILIVSGGQSAAQIVVDSEAGEVIHNAARVLRKEIHRRTGIELPVRTPKEARPNLTSIHAGVRNCDASLGRQPRWDLGPAAGCVSRPDRLPVR